MSTSTLEKKETRMVMGLFKADINFDYVFADLRKLGYNADDISVIMSDSARNQYFTSNGSPKIDVNVEDHSDEGFTTGGITGGVIGAIIGGITLTGSLFVPGSQLILFGPAVGMLAGGAAGAATGGVIGGLIGMGVPKVEAEFYHKAVEEDGNVLIVVNSAKDDCKDVEKIMTTHHAEKTNITE